MAGVKITSERNGRGRADRSREAVKTTQAAAAGSGQASLAPGQGVQPVACEIHATFNAVRNLDDVQRQDIGRLSR